MTADDPICARPGCGHPQSRRNPAGECRLHCFCPAYIAPEGPTDG